jgi:hypothetical protein
MELDTDQDNKEEFIRYGGFHCEVRIGVSLNQSVSLRASGFKLFFITLTDWFNETPIRTSQ